MLYSHKFIDVLRGASQEIPLRLIGTTTAQASAFAELINDAEKFDFGELPLEPDPTEPGKLLLPPLTPVEREAWTDGLIPLPAPLCWFEFTLQGYRSGILVRDGWTCSRYDWVKELMFDGHAARISDGMMSPSSKNLEVVIKGTIMTRDPALLRQIYGMIPPTAIYLALMLCSRSTEVTQSDEPARKLNVARAKMGRAPLEQHRIVRIVPETCLRAARAEQGLSDRLPPRLHWRRSHIRVLHRGTAEERRVLIPRFLVGRASDGEVSHEYRVVG